MRRFLRSAITERTFLVLIEEHRIGVAWWSASECWTAGAHIRRRDGSQDYEQCRASSAVEAVEALARQQGWIDEHGDPR